MRALSPSRLLETLIPPPPPPPPIWVPRTQLTVPPTDRCAFGWRCCPTRGLRQVNLGLACRFDDEWGQKDNEEVRLTVSALYAVTLAKIWLMVRGFRNHSLTAKLSDDEVD